MKIIKSIIVPALLILSLVSCSKEKKQDAKFSVVATTFPCYDAARAVLGTSLTDGTADLKLLVKPGTEVHSFDPSPADIIAVQKSSLFIYVGGESDEWVEKILDGTFTAELRLMDYVQTADEVEFGEEDEHHEEIADEEENPHEQDEHIWTSPSNELKIVEAVYESLCKAAETAHLEALCKSFELNKNKYSEEISAVASKTAKIISNADNNYIVMADRFPFLYFTNYYGLDFDAAFSGCSTAVEASTATISRLIDTVKERNLPAVFYIELGNHKLADTISEACKVKSILLQSCQNVTKTDFDNGETWVSLMERNAIALEKGL